MQWTTQQPLNGFSWNLRSSKICWHILGLVRLTQQHWTIYIKRLRTFLCTFWAWLFDYSIPPTYNTFPHSTLCVILCTFCTVLAKCPYVARILRHLKQVPIKTYNGVLLYLKQYKMFLVKLGEKRKQNFMYYKPHNNRDNKTQGILHGVIP
jgi:hypothetical protein